jgi:hypothetical protein
MEITPQFLADYFTGRKKRLSYNDSVVSYQYLRFHFDGPERVNGILNYNNADGQSPRDYVMDIVMAELIHNRRPSETIEIWEYRKSIFECITKEVTSSVLRSLTKIKRSSDWSIKYDKEAPPSIADDETLEQYCEYKFPMHYESVTNWAFSILLKNLLIDPNAVCLVMPLNQEVESKEYRKPYPLIFNSNQVYEYIYDKVAVLLTVEKTEKNGNIFLVITPEFIEKWEQKGNTADYELTDSYAHGLEKMPCFRLPGVFKKAYSSDYSNESHISPMLPALNEAVRVYSDFQAEVVMHVFSETVEYASQKCEECFDPVLGMSTGKTKGNGKKLIQCQKCNGTGLMGAAPYKKTVLRNPKLDEQPIPTPGKWYIEKNNGIVDKLMEIVKGAKFDALATINMQFLADTPLSQSGKAKEVDKDELNNFIYAIAEDIVKAMDRIYYLINEYRYKDIITSEKLRIEQLPTIPVPEKFDLLSSSYLIDEMKGAKDAGTNEITRIAFELDFCSKKFYNQPEVRNELSLVFKLDPLPAKSEDEKLAVKQGMGCTELDYIISSNIVPFVRQAMDEDKDFFNKKFPEQRQKMEEYGQKKLDTNSLKQKALEEATKSLPNFTPGN